MSLDHNKIVEIARLAMLEILPEDIESYATQLSRMHELINKLDQFDTDSIEPMTHPLDMVQRLRPDQVSETDQRELFQSIAPAVSDGLYLVPKVIE